jgi:hypothetical protein
MAKGRMDLSAFVGKLLAADEPDVLRAGVRVLAQAVMETEVTVSMDSEKRGKLIRVSTST